MGKLWGPKIFFVATSGSLEVITGTLNSLPTSLSQGLTSVGAHLPADQEGFFNASGYGRSDDQIFIKVLYTAFFRYPNTSPPKHVCPFCCPTSAWFWPSYVAACNSLTTDSHHQCWTMPSALSNSVSQFSNAAMDSVARFQVRNNGVSAVDIIKPTGPPERVSHRETSPPFTISRKYGIQLADIVYRGDQVLPPP